MAARRPATMTFAVVAVVMVRMMVAMERAEAGHNCICECMKLCHRADIPDMQDCEGECREKACIRSCDEACTNKGFPKQPNEGIPTCEVEPLSPDEQHMIPDPKRSESHDFFDFKL